MTFSPLRTRLCTAWFVVGSFLAVGWCVEPEALPLPLARAHLAPELTAAAQRENLRLFHTDPLGEERSDGDAIVLWIGTTNAGEHQQWLVALQRAHATRKELTAHQPRAVTRYLPWGSTVVFESDAEAIDLWIAGPVVVDPSRSSANEPALPPKTRRTRVYLAKDILQMGLDDTVRAQRFLHRQVEEIKHEDPAFNADHIFALHKPIDPKTVHWAKPRAERMGMTPEIERTWVGGWVALHAIYEALNGQPDLRRMVEVAFDKPSMLRLAKMALGTVFYMGIDGVNSKVLDPAQVNLPPIARECLEAPFLFSFDHRAISHGALVVTTPKPPLDLSAGILGAIAVHPKDRTRMVQASVISIIRSSATVPLGGSTQH